MGQDPHPRLLGWWRDNPADPDRPSLHHPDVQELIAEIGPGQQARDLGGVMSLNVLLQPARLVLRIHQPFVSTRRLRAVQEVRRLLAGRGLVVPVPRAWRNEAVFRCGARWAELEAYIPHQRAAPSPDAYRRLFSAAGALHRALAPIESAVPRPLVATYAPPGSLRRWLRVTEAAVQQDPEAAGIACLLRGLLNRLHAQWIPRDRLQRHLIHGDIRLSNVCRTPEGETVYLDFGFLARRQRIHDLAYAIAFMVRGLDKHGTPEHVAWHDVPGLIEAYEAAAEAHLAEAERRALAPYTAAVPLYTASLAGFARDPAGVLRATRPFLRLSEWLLAHPDALLG